MKTLTLAASLILSSFTACQSAPEKEKPAPAKPATPAKPAKPAAAENTFAKAPALKWDIVTKEQENSGAPLATVKLIADGKSADFVKALAQAPIEKAEWKANKIPADALIALGGFWAGSGDYYYVKLENGKLVAYHAVDGEGTKGERKFNVMKKKFGPADFK